VRASGGAILYTALLASIGVLFLQSWAQRYVAAAATAVVMALEPIFATLFAIGFGGETLTLRLVLGGALILGAILLSTVGEEGETPVTDGLVTVDEDVLAPAEPTPDTAPHSEPCTTGRPHA